MRHPAQRRLALEELLAHHLSLRRQRIAMRRHRAPPLAPPGQLVERCGSLPFALTGAQRACSRRCAGTWRGLRRCCGWCRATSVRARRWWPRWRRWPWRQGSRPRWSRRPSCWPNNTPPACAWLEPLGVRLAWLAGKVTGKAREATLDAIARGEAQVTVGTHALMQEGVAFRDLALAIVDEQHRFGVHQRLALRDKGARPDRCRTSW
jgi:ATP-dependent DNA helicase RecG